jgi:hypothetical protein
MKLPARGKEQLDLQALHRVRERWVMRCTAVVNQSRSLLVELPKGRRDAGATQPIASGHGSLQEIVSRRETA